MKDNNVSYNVSYKFHIGQIVYALIVADGYRTITSLKIHRIVIDLSIELSEVESIDKKQIYYYTEQNYGFQEERLYETFEEVWNKYKGEIEKNITK